VIAVAEQGRATTTEQGHKCPTCQRHIGSTCLPRDLPSGMTVLTKAFCVSCKKWRWFDGVTGRPVESHHEVRRVV
jgi:C4-type Zn-finger protein